MRIIDAGNDDKWRGRRDFAQGVQRVQAGCTRQSQVEQNKVVYFFFKTRAGLGAIVSLVEVNIGVKVAQHVDHAHAEERMVINQQNIHENFFIFVCY
jgi:hypothetical protein